MACLPKTDFRFEHSVPGCHFRLTIRRSPQQSANAELRLSGELHGGYAQPFSSGLLMSANVEMGQTAHTERVLQAVHLLLPEPVSEECIHMLRQALENWVAGDG